MRERVFHCGLSLEQRAEFPSGTALRLEKDVGNLTLKLEHMRSRLVGNEPKRLTDFIEIASYVFAADRMIRRGPLTDPGFGVEWRRSFLLVVAVRDLEFWHRQDVKDTLSDSLGFLSEDTWRFEFVDNLTPIALNEYFAGLKKSGPDAAGEVSILLFSGGLDSLAGAVHELRTSNRHVVLVSHRNLAGIGRRQKKMARQLSLDYPNRVTHVWVDNSLKAGLAREETQRTRSLFFTAMAAVAAHIETGDRIRFYENGVMSLNLPIATQVVGARASWSTHPKSLQLLGQIVGLLALHPITIENPFIWQTKIEVVQGLARSQQASLITESVSCTKARTANSRHKPHCGNCLQCLHRRLSTLAGGAEKFDESDGYESDLLTGARHEGRDRVMVLETVELALDCAGISDRDFMARFAGPLAWVLQACPIAERADAARKVIDVYRRHGLAVHALMIDAGKSHLQGVMDRTLSPDSLLALVLKSRLADVALPVADAPIKRLPEPPPSAASVPEIAENIVIAIDEQRQRICIRDQAELYGDAIFPLMKLLIEVSLDERSKPGLPRGYRSVRAGVLVDELDLSSEEAVRAVVRRARAELEEAATGLGLPFDPNAVIETTKGGYRLNPKVVVVTIEEFRRP